MPDFATMIIWSFVILVINLPFGYWRDHVRKYSYQWIIAIHLPVPFVILIRILSHVGWHWMTFIVFIGAFIAGQWLGGVLHRKHQEHCPGSTSSCLIMDLYRNCGYERDH